jgi:hypothetical protein
MTTNTSYRVTAPLVSIRTAALAGVIPGRTGYTLISLYKGAVVPADAPEADVQRLLAGGYIQAVQVDA